MVPRNYRIAMAREDTCYRKWHVRLMHRDPDWIGRPADGWADTFELAMCEAALLAMAANAAKEEGPDHG
jgi:hypothetical protein